MYRSSDWDPYEGPVITDGQLADAFPRLADDLLKLYHLEAQLEGSLYRALDELRRVQALRKRCAGTAAKPKRSRKN